MAMLVDMIIFAYATSLLLNVHWILTSLAACVNVTSIILFYTVTLEKEQY